MKRSLLLIQQPEGWVSMAALSALLLFSPPVLSSLAQGLNAEGAVEAIIGSQVETEEQAATEAHTKEILTAISGAGEAAMEVRMVFNLESVTIVFIPEAEEEGSPIAEAVREHQASIKSLRQAVQGNAMLFHSVDSRSILLDKILAMQLDDDGHATIYVAGKDPNA